MRFLLFTVYAPLAACGEIAVGERRMGWARPARSAILGLVAAAQGRDRAEEAAHRQLDASLYYAVRTDAPGRPWIDYHTAQTPKARRGEAFVTRRAELQSDDLNTVLSSREWRADACFTVALWPRPNAGIDLDAVADALRRPCFALYLGRKAAPLGLPLDPALIEADTFMAAFAARERNAEEAAVLERIRAGDAPAAGIACDADAPGAPPNARVERRRDAIVSRARWQFADRRELVELREGDQG